MNALAKKNDHLKRQYGERHQGFTLVELLVVIAILSVLAALLMPALVSARRQVLTVECVSLLHQHNLAILGYTSDYNDYYPRLVAPGGDITTLWYTATDDYLTAYQPSGAPWIKPLRARSVWACSATWEHPVNERFNFVYAGGPAGPWDGGFAYNFGSYLMGYLWNRNTATYDPTLGYLGRRISGIRSPAKMPLMTDGNGALRDLYTLPSTIAPADQDRWVAYRHANNVTNVLYVDSHIESTPAIKRWYWDW